MKSIVSCVVLAIAFSFLASAQPSAPLVYELACPSGYSPVASFGKSFNSVTNKWRANVCIHDTGDGTMLCQMSGCSSVASTGTITGISNSAFFDTAGPNPNALVGNPNFFWDPSAGFTIADVANGNNNLFIGNSASGINGFVRFWTSPGNYYAVLGSRNNGGGVALYMLPGEPTNITVDLAALIIKGTAVMPTGLLTTNTCATAVTVAATNVLATDAIEWSYNAAPGAPDGLLEITPYVTAGNVNFLQCNPTSASQTPVAATINWRVIR